MKQETLEKGMSLVGKIKKLDGNIEKLAKLQNTPNDLRLTIKGSNSIEVSTAIKVEIISDCMKKLGIEKAQVQSEFEEL